MPKYDLETRAYRFAQRCRALIDALPKDIANAEYAKQLARSSGSQAANYIEANESFGEKDFAFRIRICIKEAKESALWLGLCQCKGNSSLEDERQALIGESQELRKIFGAILAKTRNKITKSQIAKSQ